MSEVQKVSECMSRWSWNSFAEVCNALGSQFNDPTWRMMKGEVICGALEKISNGTSKYVDEVGYDLIFMDKKIEVKTEKRLIKNNLDTKSIQLKNTRGTTQKFNKTFDYLLLINTEAPFIAALATWDEVHKNHTQTGDQIQCVLKSEDLVLLTPKSGAIIGDKSKSTYHLKEYIRDGIRKWISGICEEE